MQNQTKPPRFGSPEYTQMMKDAKKSQPNGDVQISEHEPVFISCNKLAYDADQPFRLYNDEELADLAMRIKQSGLLNPIIVRPTENGKYEVLSGRNRTRAVMMNGDKEIAAFIRDVDDDEAKMIMLNANLGQRENLLPSEKAKAYKMEAEILNRQGKRPDASFSNNCEKFDAHKIIGKRHDESKRTITYYIRLTHLLPELLKYVDEKKLPLITGVEISYLNEYEQQILLNLFISKGVKPSAEELSGLRKLSKAGELNIQVMQEFFEESRKRAKKEFIKLDKSKFSQFAEIINNTKNLEKCFLDFLHAQRRKKGVESNVTK